MKKVHINDRADMSVFKGTPYEGMTYMQVRRALNPEQLARFERIQRRERAVLKHKRQVTAHAKSYR